MSGPVKPYLGIMPTIADDVFIADTAAVIGDVHIGAGSSVWYSAVIRGDALEPCISAASILAKTHRDRQMLALDREYPEYQFARHKGYPTALHRELLKKHGVSPVHRRSFGPVRELL